MLALEREQTVGPHIGDHVRMAGHPVR